MFPQLAILVKANIFQDNSTSERVEAEKKIREELKIPDVEKLKLFICPEEDASVLPTLEYGDKRNLDLSCSGMLIEIKTFDEIFWQTMYNLQAKTLEENIHTVKFDNRLRQVIVLRLHHIISANNYKSGVANLISVVASNSVIG